MTPRERARDGAHAERRGDERPVAKRRRRLRRTRRPVAHRVVLAPVQAVDRELDHERDGLGEPGRSSSASALSSRARACLWRPSRCSTPAHAATSRTRSAASASAGTIRMPSSSAGVAVREAARWPQALPSGRAGARPAPVRARSPAAAAARRRTSARRSRAPARGSLSRLAQHGDRVARRRRAPRSRRGARAPTRARRVRERRRGPLVRAEPPAAGRGLVDRPADQRMAEAEAPRDVGGADQVEREQIVERVDRRRLAPTPAAAAGEIGVERVAGHGSALEHAASRRRQQTQLLGQRGDHGRRDLDAADGEVGRGRHRDPPPACGCVRAARDRTGCRRSPRTGRPRRRARSLRPSSSSASPLVRASARGGRAVSVAMRRVERGREALVGLTRARGEREQHRRGRRAVQQRAEQLDRRRVAPVEVVEHQHERLRPPAARAARGRRGGCGSARAAAPPPGPRPARTARGTPSPARPGRRPRARRAGAARGPGGTRRARRRRPRTAGRARAPSADPDKTRCPRASARAASSASRRVLPMPGSPTSSIATGRPSSTSSMKRSNDPSSTPRPTKCSRPSRER